MEGRWPEEGVLGLVRLLTGDSFGPDLDLEEGSIVRARGGAAKRQSGAVGGGEEEEEEEWGEWRKRKGKWGRPSVRRPHTHCERRAGEKAAKAKAKARTPPKGNEGRKKRSR